jgi:hypothetical protein
VFDTVEQTNPDIIAVENIVFHFPIFAPTGREYSERLKHANPGPAAWQTRLTKLGYGTPLVFPRIASLDALQLFIGSGFQSTIEGVGGDVFILEKAQQRVIRPIEVVRLEVCL